MSKRISVARWLFFSVNERNWNIFLRLCGFGYIEKPDGFVIRACKNLNYSADSAAKDKGDSRIPLTMIGFLQKTIALQITAIASPRIKALFADNYWISDFFSASIKSKSHFNKLQFYLFFLFYVHANYYNCSCHNQLSHFGLGNTSNAFPSFKAFSKKKHAIYKCPYS